MAYDEGLVQILRDDLADVAGIGERKMFGGLCFMLNGNMLCGIHKGGGMFRVGKAAQARALAVEGADPLGFTGRPMGGMVEVGDATIVDDTRRGQLLKIALEFVSSLPAK